MSDYSLLKLSKGTNEAYNELYDWLKDNVTSTTVVVAEKPHAGQFFNAVRKLFGLLAVAELYCEQVGCPFHLVSPTPIKKFWTGSGKANKAAMKAATVERGLKISNHNVNDAFALCYYWHGLQGWPLSLPVEVK
jgi:Holliday junction resolvasome RuvABC endonuclease subunit